MNWLPAVPNRHLKFSARSFALSAAGILLASVTGLRAETHSVLVATREANAGMSSAFQLAAVSVSLIVLASAFRNSSRRRKISSDEGL